MTSGSRFWPVTFYIFTADQCLTNPRGASQGSGAFVSKTKQCPYPAGQYFFSKMHHSLHVPRGFPGVSPRSTPGKANDKCIICNPPLPQGQHFLITPYSTLFPLPQPGFHYFCGEFQFRINDKEERPFLNAIFSIS